MNSFHSVTSGLLSSLFLSLGYSRLAARFDLLEKSTLRPAATPDAAHASAFSCVLPCRLPEASAFSCVLPCRWQEV